MSVAPRILAGLALVLLAGACTKRALDLVDDQADLLTREQEEGLVAHHRFLAADHDIDYRVVTSRGIDDIDRHAAEVFAASRIGASSKAGRGLLLLIDADADLVRLEVGYALEGVFPDAFVAYVEARQMVPFFQANRVADGVLATTELIIARVQRAKAGGGYDGEPWFVGSGGGGAKREAEIGSGYERPEPRATAAAGSARSPSATLKLYLDAMARHDAAPDAAIYTPQTRAMLTGWVVTRGQMDNLVETYRRCSAPVERRDAKGDLAVLRYAALERACAPWFFRRAGDDWQLDLTMMQTAIRFGRDNSWRLVPGVSHPYAFAFDDWRFDANGFPRAEP